MSAELHSFGVSRRISHPKTPSLIPFARALLLREVKHLRVPGIFADVQGHLWGRGFVPLTAAMKEKQRVSKEWRRLRCSHSPPLVVFGAVCLIYMELHHSFLFVQCQTQKTNAEWT